MFPTPKDALELVRELMGNRLSIARFDRVQRNGIPGMEMRYFDMTLNDGRVYRVRVSDITPLETVDEGG